MVDYFTFNLDPNYNKVHNNFYIKKQQPPLLFLIKPLIISASVYSNPETILTRKQPTAPFIPKLGKLEETSAFHVVL